MLLMHFIVHKPGFGGGDTAATQTMALLTIQRKFTLCSFVELILNMNSVDSNLIKVYFLGSSISTQKI